MTTPKQPHIERAEEVVAAELAIITDERDAWTRFLRRIDDLPTRTSGGNETRSSGAGATATLAAPAPSHDVDRVRTAYRETVMAVPHYDTEYGDSLMASLAAEIDPNFAALVANATSLSPPVYRAVKESATQAKRDRAEFQRFLDRERSSLEAAARRLNGIEAAVYDLESRVERASTDGDRDELLGRLDGLERRCNDLADRRQDLIHNRSTSTLSGIEGRSLTTYLYGDTDATFPVLTDVASCVETISYRREQCRR